MNAGSADLVETEKITAIILVARELSDSLIRYDSTVRQLMKATKEATHILSVRLVREDAKKVTESKGGIQDELNTDLRQPFSLSPARILAG